MSSILLLRSKIGYFYIKVKFKKNNSLKINEFFLVRVGC